MEGTNANEGFKQFCLLFYCHANGQFRKKFSQEIPLSREMIPPEPPDASWALCEHRIDELQQYTITALSYTALIKRVTTIELYHFIFSLRGPLIMLIRHLFIFFFFFSCHCRLTGQIKVTVIIKISLRYKTDIHETHKVLFHTKNIVWREKAP